VEWDPAHGYPAIRQIQGKMIPAPSKSLEEIKTTPSFIQKFPIVSDGCQVRMNVIGREYIVVLDQTSLEYISVSE
jgi:hypothetical protein